jgi:hypothetical protein
MSINDVIRYFDLASDVRIKKATSMGKGKEFHWFPQYLALLAGIVAQRFLQEYMSTGKWNPTGFWLWLLAACIIAVIIFPGIYKNVFDPEKPLFVQLCVIFTNGVGWQALSGTVFKAAGIANQVGTVAQIGNQYD